MSTTVRQCSRCGRQDDREHWSSMDAAAKAGAPTNEWTCPACGAVESELVERSADTRPPRVATLDTNLAELPDDPDERRRAVETTLPLNHP